MLSTALIIYPPGSGMVYPVDKATCSRIFHPLSTSIASPGSR